MFFTLSIVYLAFIYSAKGQGYRYGCPDTSSTTQCTCSSSSIPNNNGYQVTVTCSNFNGDYDVFSNTLTSLLLNYEIDELIITGYNPDRLSDKTFTDNGNPSSLIKKISIINSPNLAYLGYINSNFTFFEGLGPSLEVLYIENTNNIRAEEWTRVAKSLTKDSVLHTLTLYKNDLSSFTSLDNFNVFLNVEKINMRQNNLINGIKVNLTKFSNLKFLDLCGSQLSNFELTGNSSTLTTIYLRNNQIQYIRPSIITFLGSLRLIDFTGNPLSCYCEDVQDIIKNPDIVSFFRGNCNLPANLAGKPLNDKLQCSTDLLRSN